MKFEYMASSSQGPFSVRELDELGDEGWELVAVTPVPGETVAYFKRSVLEEKSEPAAERHSLKIDGAPGDKTPVCSCGWVGHPGKDLLELAFQHRQHVILVQKLVSDS